MDLTLNEQKLLADFRRLTPEGQRELLASVELLLHKGPAMSDQEPLQPDNQCPVAKQEARPEAAAEPIFTE